MKAHSRRQFLKTGTMAGSIFLLPNEMKGNPDDPALKRGTPFPPGTDPASPLLDIGCLDITKAPYFADPTGERDSTRAIQQAANDARDHALVCFFPEGTYLISDTISCEQKVEKLDQPKQVDGGTQHYWPVYKPMILMGSTRGKRPVLKLSREAKGFDDPAKPKLAIWIWAQTWFDAPGKEEPIWGKEQANISFNHFFIGIDIDIRGHSGAIGIRHSGSQGSSLMNSTIHAEGAYAGMNNCCGQGGGTYNIEVFGGEYGIVINSDSRFPILTSCIFRDQRKAAIGYEGGSIQVPTLLVGCLLKPDSSTVVDMTASNSYGGIIMVDCLYELKKRGCIALTRKRENIFIENSYGQGIESVYSGGPSLPESHKVLLIERFSSHTEQGVNLMNGTESTEGGFQHQAVSSAPAYQTIHEHHYPGIPTFEDKAVVNVKVYGARGDGTTDDTGAFRKAIAASDKIFVPKGQFRLSGALQLGSRTQIFGLSRSFTAIGSGNFKKKRVADDDGIPPDSSERDSFSLLTVDDPKASPGLTFVSVRGGIEWKSGKGTWMLVSGAPRFSGHGGGRFYGLGAMGQQFVLEGIRQSTSFYALNVERVLTNPQAEIRNCSHVRIYYFKVEAGTIQPGNPLIDRDANTPGRISNSSDLRIYCMYGNVTKLVDRPMLDIVNSSKVLVCQVKAFRPGSFPHLTETWKGQKSQIPSVKTCALFVRD